MSDLAITPVEVTVEDRCGDSWFTVTARKAKDGTQMQVTYKVLESIGKGTFGTVRKIISEDGQVYALKNLVQDTRYKSREMSLMRELDHMNCTRLYFFFAEKDRSEHVLKLNLMMEFLPCSLGLEIKEHRDGHMDMDPFTIKLYSYQMLRGLAYLHSKRIAHRDLKPQNILTHVQHRVLKLCDFGSAKRLSYEQPNVAYICSRYYRAPELILGNTRYDCSVDTWSAGCILAEMFVLKPLFVGDSSIDQLTEIIRLLGTPSLQQMEKLHPKFPRNLKRRDPVSLKKILRRKPCSSAIHLLTRLLQYAPDNRLPCWDALAEPYFEELRKTGLRRADGGRLPQLFGFTSRELDQNPILNQLIVPSGEPAEPETKKK